MKYYTFILLLPWLFSLSLCEVSEETRTKLLSDFISYYNLKPNQVHVASEGFLRSIRQIDPVTYKIEVSFKAQENDNVKLWICVGTVEDLGDEGVAIVNNDLGCAASEQQPVEEGESIESVEVQGVRSPVKLENEVQADTAITSGEQFIAIPRDQPSAPCIGCASHVNPQAPGVTELASLGVRHLDLHEPTVKHSLDSVKDVERQVQVVSGVRYILTLSIKFSNCTEVETDSCISTKTCKVSVLVKPWQTLPSGAKYRAILANNCTEQWLFGDDGEILPEPHEDHDNQENKGYSSADVDDIKVERHEDTQSHPNQEKILTIDEIRTIEDQILPNDHAQSYSNQNQGADISSSDNIEISKDHVVKDESAQRYNDNYVTVTESAKYEKSVLGPDKKKAIDEMLDFLDFSNFKPKTQNEETLPRVKRSYDYDLQVLSLTEDFRELKKSIENAKYIYEMAQFMVDYLNEMDMVVKNRAIKNVIKAEEEEDNDKRFIYIQAQVVIPCETANCAPKEMQTKICNGVLDSTNKKNPQILNTFCYIDTKEMDSLNNIKEIPLDDPVLLRLTKEIIRKIESESTDPHAIKIRKIVTANTQVVSGRLTKVTLIVDRISCNKSVPLVLRTNCHTLQYLGSNLCEILVHEKHWLKEKKISYTCTERPIHMTFSEFKQKNINISIDDPKINEILQEALQYLEIQSDKKNKQKIVNVNKISTQIIAGFLINIEFVVGYTNCTDANDLILFSSSECEFLKNESLRGCKAQIWDRSWIVDGRQMEVSCDDDAKDSIAPKNTRKKRSLDFVGGRTQEMNEQIPRTKQQIGDLRQQNLFGGMENQDVKDPKYTKLAEESLQKYIRDSDISQSLNVLRIEKVTTQVVSGLLTRIDFIVSSENGTDILKCYSKVWEQAWLKKKEIDVSCQIINERIKRQIPGGRKTQNPNDPKYLQLANESLKKYLENTGNTVPHRVVQVQHVTTQVVSGILTEISFVVSPIDTSKGDTLNCISKIWEEDWIKKKEIDVSCQITNERVKRQIPGGRTNQNPNDPKYLQLANESLNKYLENTGSAVPHRVDRVDHVTTQVVSGELTEISFVVSPIDTSKGDALNCISKIWEQAWLKKKEIDVSCQINNERVKRQKAGGPVNQNPNDPQYLQLANESLNKYLENTGNTVPHRVVQVQHVTTQVVSGILTEISFVVSAIDNPKGDTLNCISKIWEEDWIKKKEIDVSCQITNERVKRQIPGGPMNQNPNDPQYLQLANESLNKYLENTGNTVPHRVVQVQHVTTQVVSGILTEISFVVSPIDTSKGDTLNCISKIWEEDWIKKKEIDVSCQITNERVKRQIPGGRTNQNPNDPKYLQLANESLNKYLENTGSTVPHRVDQIEHVTTQVVSGELTEISFVVSPIDTSKGDTLNCISKIWEQAWIKKKEIDVSCQINNERIKRQIPGGRKTQNPNDPKYLQLANESLNKYLENTGSAVPHRVDRVDHVTTQVVSGELTEISFVVSPIDTSKGDALNCISKIWEQAWLKKKEIDVSCQINNERVKRQKAGGPVNQNPNDPQYLQLANESLNKYLENTGNTVPHRVVQVQHVTTQVVSGILTEISFVVSPIDTSKGDTLNCISKIWEEDWIKKKEIDVSCQITNERVKRQIPGGPMNQNPNDPQYLQLANESLNKYLENTGNTVPHRVVQVQHVTTQVVSGVLTEISFVVSPIDTSKGDTLNCISKIWEQAWLKKKEIDVSCQIINERVKRQKAGGPMNQNPNDPQYLQLANESLNKYLENTGNTVPHRVVQVQHVTTQVVSGILTEISFVVSPIDTSKGDTLNCISKIWEEDWIKKKEIDVSCQITNERVKRQIPGGRTNQNPNDPKYLQLANESLNKYLENTGSAVPHRVDRVDHVTTQVVSGELTEISFVVSPIDTSKGDALNCISKIWEQAWLKKKEIDVSCQINNERVKRQIPGGRKTQNPNDPKYLQLANESLNKYLENTGSTVPHRVDQIEHVTTQVVSGELTEISFVVSPIDTSKGDTLNCISKIWEQAWIKKKEIDVSCQITNERVKRQIPGGRTNQNPNDPKYLQLANESLNKYLENTGSAVPHRVDRVDHVTTQVVSGELTEISFVVSPIDTSKGDALNCISKIWEQAWLKKKEIDVSCQINNERVKRQIPGGRKTQNPNDPKYLQLANESLNKYLENTGSTVPHRVDQIEHVTTQVVSGELTEISFVVSPIDTSKGDTLNCISKIWEEDWIKKKEIDVSCQINNERVKRQKAGGPVNQNPNDPQYLQLANESLNKYLENTGNTVPHRVVQVQHVTTQVVSGILTEISFVVSPIDTSKGDTLNCISKIWEEDWIKKKEIDVSCQITNERVKRQIPGGPMNQNPNDPQYLQLANESLNKYLENTGNTVPHRVVQVQHVTTQVVSGVLTEISFVVSPIDTSKGDTLNCISKIWEQAWLKKKEIDVSCQINNERVKRQKAGGPMNQNPNDPQYLQLANESLNKYLENTGNTVPHRVVQVQHVTTQVVSGILTEISFVVSPIDTSKGDTLNCISKIWEEDWIKKKEIDVSCQITNERVKRQIPGGRTNQNPNDPKYLQLANESLNKYLENTGSAVPHRVDRVDHVTTQVVSGELTEISFVVSPIDTSKGDALNCISKIWEQAWLKKKEIDVSCQINNERVKRQIPGGRKTQNPNDPKYLQLANESLNKYLENTGSTVPHRVDQIEHVTTQVVSGELTEISFVVSPIDTSKGDTLNCISKIWEQAWIKKKEIDVSCQINNERIKRQIPGGRKTQNPNDPKYLQLANESLNKYLENTGSTVPHRVDRVDHVTTQVVSGELTEISFVVSPIDTSRGDTLNCISKIWEQAWLKKKEIDVSCQINSERVKRQLDGVRTNQNPNDPKYLQLANESLNKYLENTGSTVPHRVDRVEHVTTQVVSGELTVISFVVSPIDTSKGDALNCISKIWEQAWLKKKEIDVSCQINNERVKRQIPGGRKTQNPNDPKYLQLANESLNKYLENTGSTVPHRVDQIEHVTTQVVSGELTEISFVVSPIDTSKGDTLNCISKIWEQAWIKKKEIDVSCQINNERIKRQIPGGRKTQNPNDPKYLQLANESLNKYLENTGSTVPHRVDRVDHVTTQVVSGELTEISFVVSPIDTSRGDTLNCISKIWEQAWIKKKEIDVSCQINSERVKRQIDGVRTNQNPNDPKYLQLANESLNKYLENTGSTVPHRVDRVEHVTTQVVSGVLTEISFVVSPIDTSRGDTLNCISKIWEQAWLKKKEIDVSCQINSEKVKRQIDGGRTNQNPNDPKYLQLANESLNKYLENTGSTVPHRVDRVEHVTTQVVSGELTEISFEVSPIDTSRGDTLNCISKIWEQAWIKKKEIDVSCQINKERVKRQKAGGPMNQNPNDPQYLQLANESLNKYLENTGNTVPHRVVQVQHVTTQVVSGVLTEISFVVSPIDTSKGDTLNCISKIWEQAWLKKKEIDVSCQINNERVKRQIPGGRKTQNPNDPKYFQLANESLNKFLENTGSTVPHRVDQIEHVTTQVVSGELTEISFVVSPIDTSKGDTLNCISKIWEQAWLKKKEIDVSCQINNERIKRQIPGGRKTQNPNDPKYLQLANESLNKYLENTGSTVPHRVDRVDHVTTQVVSGELTEISFVVSPIDTSRGDTLNCISKIWEQAWLKKKEIDVSCQINNERVKRQIDGGRTNQNPNDPKYLQLANESLNKYLENTGSTVPHRVDRVEHVTTQVVSGELTEISFVVSPIDTSKGDTLNCISKIWEQAWLKKKEIDVSCQINNERVKRQKAGGPVNQNPNDPQYLQLANESLNKYLENTGNTVPHRVVQVQHVTTQVVSGVLTEISFVVSPIDTSRGGTLNCISKIWEQAWLKKKEIDVSCQINKERVKRQKAGGPINQNPNDPQYLQLANESLNKYLENTGNTVPHRVVQVQHVTTQVVSGVLTEISFVVSPIDTSKGDTLNCISKIWEQAWLKKKEIDVSCQINNERVKRQIPGGRITQNPSDPKFLQLANESLNKYLENTGSTIPHRVDRVEHVTTQVVSGELTEISFVVSPIDTSKGDTLNCISKIWEQAWLKKKEIDVSCQINNERVERQIAGSLSDENPNDPKYLQLANESLHRYLSESGNHKHNNYKVIRVEKVTTQIVSGLLTRLNFVVLPADTTKSLIINCYSEVLEQPGLDKKDIKVSCQNHDQRLKSPILGGIKEEDPSDAKYLQLADESLQKYLSDSGNQNPYKIVRIEQVTTQVVAGILIRINFVVTRMDNLEVNGIMNCFSEILEQAWLNKKEINVICESDSLKSRPKRELMLENDINKQSSEMKNDEEEGDVTQPEYQLLAAQALRKYSKRIGKLHRLKGVQHVTKRIVAGIKYKIDFSASPTECFSNVSNVRALTCKVMDTTIYCSTQIWDQPWIRKKTIHVRCSMQDGADYADYSDEETTTKAPSPGEIPKSEIELSEKKQLSNAEMLAEEALEIYLSSSNRKYVYRITEITSFYEHLADGIITKIEFWISPTVCLRYGYIDSTDNCEFKKPRVEYYCNAKIHDRPWLGVDKDIQITCKKIQNNKSKVGKRLKRQTDTKHIEDEDNEIDEDTSYYYAERALNHFNERIETNNLYKLITIHAVQTSVLMKTTVVKIYIEIAETYCLRQRQGTDVSDCEEMEGLNHRLCLARIFPSPDDELVIRHVTIVCDDNDDDFNYITGLNVQELLRLSIEDLERQPDHHFKIVHQGEPQVIPSLESSKPVRLNFIIAVTNCSKNVDLSKDPFQCFIDSTIPPKACHSFIWLETQTRTIHLIDAKCDPGPKRLKRSDSSNATADDSEINKLVSAALENLEMQSIHTYKQRVLHINSYSSKITSGKVTTIDFDVGYTSCLKYEWIKNVTSCDFLEHMPRRHCVAQIWERLWINNGMNIDVSCEDDETPLEAHIEFESAEMAMQLAQEALKHIEAKYPHPKKQKVVRIFSLEKQVVAGIHYRMKVEVGLTTCVALSDQTDCKLEKDGAINKFCRVNVWVRPWTDHPPNFRVTCDYQDGATSDLFYHVQAEQLFYNFMTRYNPTYVNDHSEVEKRFEIFKENIRKIHEMNVHEKGTATYGVTRFTDLTYSEFRSRYMGLKTNLRDTNQAPTKQADIPNIKIPSSFDWRTSDAVTEVKDQGTCGSCWAFSAIGNIESHWKIRKGELVTLSEQELLDCDKIDDGCNGGLPENAYRSIEQLGGLETETNYPYEAGGDQCLFNKTMAKVSITGSVNITTNETGMAQWLVHNGPISVGMNGRAMQFYQGGISHPWKTFCDDAKLDHSALIVGYGVLDHVAYHRKIPYWIIKNSWGKNWGDQGYYFLHRGGGTCGVNRLASSALVD